MSPRPQKTNHNTSWLQRILETIWYQGGSGAYLLKPLEALYRLLARLDKHFSLNKQVNHFVPVIVVGNISVGGTGKTPLVIYLAHLLKEAGYRPGIITRGYGGSASHWPLLVEADGDASLYGDEPVLMAQRSGVPVVAGPDRNADVDALLQPGNIDIVISDDGLQHYRLKRDIEIVVIDGERGLGNEYCLPAGPLREPKSRLASCDFVIFNEPEPHSELSMQLQATLIRRLNSDLKQPLSDWKGRHIHAVTGIGNPLRFFNMLEESGLMVTRHSFPDHHAFSQADVDFADEIPVVMTEKDAVKCRGFAKDNHWFVPVTAIVTSAFAENLLARINEIKSDKQ
ncbi:tetraacyldisaccharide 4'-kinase [Leucothrix pacifica]|uniref:tetraacyldisaccharide 4'-kinase n=1 Tax=Leucothrix pacifica TaxID=1247513 RepID=UPI001FE5E2D1|nr:tetraacyldisaccharide 4'-kinase [Leucothrix pacifica]